MSGSLLKTGQYGKIDSLKSSRTACELREMAHGFDERSRNLSARVAKKNGRRGSVHAALLIPPGGKSKKRTSVELKRGSFRAARQNLIMIVTNCWVTGNFNVHGNFNCRDTQNYVHD
jgi:hypothetical protein